MNLGMFLVIGVIVIVVLLAIAFSEGSKSEEPYRPTHVAKQPSPTPTHTPTPAPVTQDPWWNAKPEQLSGEGQRIIRSLQRRAQKQRKDWESQYRAKEKELQRKQQEIESILASQRKKANDRVKKKGQQASGKIKTAESQIDFQTLTQLHRASHLEADSTHELLSGAREVLDALGEAIVDAAKSRKNLESRKRSAGSSEAAQLEVYITGLHDLRDRVLTPDKDRIKGERDRLLGEVRSLNARTASLRDSIRDNCGKQGRNWHERLEERKRQRRQSR